MKVLQLLFQNQSLRKFTSVPFKAYSFGHAIRLRQLLVSKPVLFGVELVPNIASEPLLARIITVMSLFVQLCTGLAAVDFVHVLRVKNLVSVAQSSSGHTKFNLAFVRPLGPHIRSCQAFSERLVDSGMVVLLLDGIEFFCHARERLIADHLSDIFRLESLHAVPIVSRVPHRVICGPVMLVDRPWLVDV